MRWLVVLVIVCTSTLVYSQARYLDPIFDEVKMETFVYAEKDGQELALDVYQPKGDAQTDRPVLIWMHGGGFAGGSRANGDEVKLMQQLAQRGFVAVSISYRLLRKGKATGFSCDCPRAEKIRVFKESAYDFWDAIKYVYDRHSTFGINTDQIIIGGSSAGAEAMLTAIYMKDWIFEPGNPYEGIELAGAWSLAGAVMDARYIHAENAVPTVFFHGTADNLVPYATAAHHYCKPDRLGYIVLDGAKTIADRLATLEAPYFLYTVEGGRHEWSRIPFGQLDMVLDFFYRTLINGREVIQIHEIVQKD